MHRLVFEGTVEENIKRLGYYLMGHGNYTPKFFEIARLILQDYLLKPESQWEYMSNYLLSNTYIKRKSPLNYMFEYKKGHLIDIKSITRIDYIRHFDEDLGEPRILVKTSFANSETLFYYKDESKSNILSCLNASQIKFRSFNSLSGNHTTAERTRMFNEKFGTKLSKNHYMKTVGTHSYMILIDDLQESIAEKLEGN